MTKSTLKNINRAHLYSRMFRVPWRLYLLVTCAALLVVGIISFSIKTSDRMTKVYTPSIEAMMIIKLEVTTAHLWLEEILSGDDSQEFIDFKQHLDRAKLHIQFLVDGGNSEEWKFIPIDNPDLLEYIYPIQEKIEDFQSIAMERLAMAENSGPGTGSDLRIDIIYSEIIERTDDLEKHLLDIMAEDQRRFHSIQHVLIAVSLFLAFLVAFTLHHYQRTIVYHFRALRNAETRYTRLVEQIPAVTYIAKLDTISTTIFISPQIETLLGIPAEEFVENPDLFVEMLHPEDRQRVLKELEHSHKTGEPFRSEHRMLTKTGGIVWFRDEGIIIKDEEGGPRYLQGLKTDISAYKKADEALRREKQLSDGLISGLPGIFYLMSNDGKFLRWNRNFEIIFGYTAEEIASMRSLAFIAVPDRSLVTNLARQVFNTGEGSAEALFQTKDGRTIPHLISGASIEIGGKRCMLGLAIDISDRKRTEQAIRKYQQEISLHLEQTPLGVISFNTDFIITAWNPAAERIFGHSKEEAIGNHGGDLLVPESDRKHVDEIWQALLQKKGGTRSSNVNLTKSGNIIVCEWYNTPLVDENGDIIAVAVLVQDVTEQKRAESDLLESEAKWRSLMENSSDHIMLLDCNANILFINHTASEIHPQKVIGTSVYEYVQKEFHQIAEQCFRYVLETGTASKYETESHKESGEVNYFEVRIAPILEKGTIVGLLSSSTNITEHKIAEKNRIDLERQVQHAHKLESLGVMAGGIAHDFNNILMAILGNAEILLRKTPADSKDIKYIQQIEESAHQAAGLSGKMLAYSGQGSFTIVALEINNLILEMKQVLLVSLSKRITVNINTSNDSMFIEGDPAQFRQVIQNLFTNAIEAIGENSGTVTLTTGTSHYDRDYLDTTDLASQSGLSGHLPKGQYVWIEIIDTGCGMDNLTQEKIFDPFYTTKFTGRGLGMAAVLGIIRAHKGTMTFYSEVGKGSTFRVLLPQFISEKPITKTQQQNAEPNKTWRGKGTVLLIDDERTVRHVGKRMLEILGFSVLEAKNGREGLEVFQDQADTIDLVILDLTMPELDGEQTFREMKRIQPDVKVILSSGYNKLNATQNFVGLGLAGFIQKPYKIQDLSNILQKMIY